MAMSKYWSFHTDSNHDDLADCLIHMDYLEQVVAQSILVVQMHWGVQFQRDGSLTICGTVKYFSAGTNMQAVRNLFEDFTVNSLRRCQYVGINAALHHHLLDSVLFTNTAEFDGIATINFTVHSRISI